MFEYLGEKKVIFLLMMDLSVAYSRVYLTLQLNRLKYRYGFGSEILNWITKMFHR